MELSGAQHEHLKSHIAQIDNYLLELFTRFTTHFNVLRTNLLFVALHIHSCMTWVEHNSVFWTFCFDYQQMNTKI